MEYINIDKYIDKSFSNYHKQNMIPKHIFYIVYDKLADFLSS